MKTLHHLVFPLVLCAVGVWMGCAQPGDVHLAALGEANERVEAGLDILEQWHVDSVAACRERVAMRFKDLNWLVADSTLIFTVDDGQLIGDWARVRRYLKDGPTRLTELKKQGTLCLNQMGDLGEAIRQGATEDANGTPMDEAYFERESSREIGIADQWRLAVDETARLLQLGVDLEGESRMSIDSLIRVKRAEWAQTIANPLSE
jgi:hypothetical protein